MVRSICAHCFSKVPLVYFILYTIILHFPHFLKINPGGREATAGSAGQPSPTLTLDFPVSQVFRVDKHDIFALSSSVV